MNGIYIRKVLILFFVISTLSLARFTLIPLEECEAFNNMKHSKNTQHVILNTRKKYIGLKKYKGEFLLLIKGVNPAQRWVDEKCFSKKDLVHKKQKNKNLSKENLLALSWHNAFCETHRYKKECKIYFLPFQKSKYSEKHFVLHGLWPQPRNKIYCGVNQKDKMLDKHKQWNRLNSLELMDDVKNNLKKVMPGFTSNLHRHEWIKHGTCYGTSANIYYKNAIHLIEQLNNSKVGNFFQKNIGKRVTLQQVRGVFNRSFGMGSGKRVEFKCKGGLITELWLYLGGGGVIIFPRSHPSSVVTHKCRILLARSSLCTIRCIWFSNIT